MAQTSYWQKLRMFNSDVRCFFVSAATFSGTFYGLTSVLYNLYLLRLGYGPEFIGLVNAVSWLTSATLSLPVGALGARLGVRRVMIAGMALIMLSQGLTPSAELVSGVGRQVVLLVAHILGL